ncbi:MAG: hypothetical protein GXY94_08455 [Bacteroidales bacterium]|nr:hypothetical protein [Bacteroidales bacterium]
MHNLVLSPIDPEKLIASISEKVTANILKAVKDELTINPPQTEGVFHEYIPKTEVRGVLASSSTLWQWENKGKLKLYAIGGKRFYKRSVIEALFTEVKKGGVR